MNPVRLPQVDLSTTVSTSIVRRRFQSPTFSYTAASRYLTTETEINNPVHLATMSTDFSHIPPPAPSAEKTQTMVQRHPSFVLQPLQPEAVPQLKQQPRWYFHFV